MTKSALDYLTPEELAELDEHLLALAEAEVRPYYNGTLREFAAEVHPRFRWYRHVEVLADLLEQVVTGDIKRLMTFEPPRHGKSLLKSRIFPAYALAKRPESWFGLCSYEATLAQDFSRTARDNYLRVGGKLRDDSTAVNLWQTPQGGGLWASGVGGPITGKGFDIGSIDDPIKNEEEAASETIRKKHKSWYESTFFTRAEPDAAILLTMTRWHEDDLAGWLLEREKDDPEHWHVVNLSAIKDTERLVFPVTCTIADDWRVDGEALCPERYNEHALSKIKRTAGTRVWNALYQQRPAPDSGTIFQRDWWKYYTTEARPIDGVPYLPIVDYAIQSWDMSFKDTDSSDFVSGQVWGLKGARIYLMDRLNERLGFSATSAAMLTMSAKWPDVIGKYVEDTANGPAIINSLQREVMGIVAVKPDGGKIARAYAVQSLVEAGNVYLPHPSIAPWVEDFIRQMAGFPNAAHDDDVDAATQALNQLAWSAREAPQEPPEPSDDQHPGFDLKRRERRTRITAPDPDAVAAGNAALLDDDLRAHRGIMAGFRPPRVPRWGRHTEEEDS